MTIGIGMLCGEGAIVSADTKVTLSDGAVTHDSKLSAVKANWGSCVIANSTDDGNAAKTLVRSIAVSLDRTPTINQWEVLEHTISYEMTEWSQAFRKFPPTHLIVAASVIGIGVQLYFCEPPNTIVPHPEGYIAAGGGSAITDPLFKTLFTGFTIHYDPQRTMRLMAYLMRRAKDGNALCGGRTEAMFIKADSSEPEEVNSLDFEAAERQSVKLDFLLGATAKLALFSSPGQNLEHNAKGIGDMMIGLSGLRDTVFHTIHGDLIGESQDQ
jgi:hypothetical protein